MAIEELVASVNATTGSAAGELLQIRVAPEQLSLR
jgi:hypothetical protein